MLRQKMEKTKAENVPFGEVFLLGNKFYMLIDDVNLPSYQSDDVTILDLNNYSVLTINPNTTVTRVPAELVIG